MQTFRPSEHAAKSHMLCTKDDRHSGDVLEPLHISSLSIAYSFPTMDERKAAAHLILQVREHFGKEWNQSKFGVGSSYRNGKIHVTVAVPAKFVRKLESQLEKSYPGSDVPVIAIPMSENRVSQIEWLEDKSEKPWWQFW